MTVTENLPADEDDRPVETVPLVYMVRSGTASVLIRGVLEADLSDNDVELRVRHWEIDNQGMNPLTFTTGEEMLKGATWDTAEEALQAGEVFVKAWNEMRRRAFVADDVFRDLVLPGAKRSVTERTSAFPPGVGGEDISEQIVR